MDVDQLLDRLRYIQDRVLNVRIEDVTTDYFTAEQSELTELLQNLRDMDGDDRKIVMDQVGSFTEKLKERWNELKGHITTIEGDMDQNQIRLKGVKAYAGKIFK